MPKTRSKPQRKLTKALRLEARYRVESLIAELEPEHAIVKTIAEQFGVSSDVGRDLYNEVWRLMAEAEKVDRPTRRGRMEMVLESLYARTLKARQYGVSARVAKQLCDLFGLNAPIKLEGLREVLRDEVETRTDAELEYYDKHGHWPEEAPRKVALPDAPRDPLDRMH